MKHYSFSCIFWVRLAFLVIISEAQQPLIESLEASIQWHNGYSILSNDVMSIRWMV